MAAVPTAAGPTGSSVAVSVAKMQNFTGYVAKRTLLSYSEQNDKLWFEVQFPYAIVGTSLLDGPAKNPTSMVGFFV